VSEGWNNRLRSLVNHHHLTVWTILEALQADAAEAATTVLKQAVGALPRKAIARATAQHAQRLRNLRQEFVAGHRSMQDSCAQLGTRFV